ncbi:MAG: hypothetical protein GC150_02770 [Rhizobiales bacterium]|nr:hypothetical protein [Hyphomicrobiales bacterium]
MTARPKAHRTRGPLAALTALLLAACALPAHAGAIGHGSPLAVDDLYRGNNLNRDPGDTVQTQTSVSSGRFIRLFELNRRYQTSGQPFIMQPHQSTVEQLRQLGRVDGPMHEQSDQESRNSNVPSGYVFFGQFVDHDVTFDTVSSLDRPIRDSDTENARTPALDLDCVYGGGPDRTPYLFDLPYLVEGAEIAQGRRDLLRRTTFANGGASRQASAPAKPAAQTPAQAAPARQAQPQVQQQQVRQQTTDSSDINNAIFGGGGGATQPQQPQQPPAAQPAPQPQQPPAQAPVPANPHFPAGAKLDVALIGDPRNDENVVISQLQAAFIAYHNKVVDHLLAKDGINLAQLRRNADAATGEQRLQLLADLDRISKNVFERARNHVIHYYHRMIVEDFLPRIIGLDRVQAIRTKGRKLYYPRGWIDRQTGERVQPQIPLEFSGAAYRFAHSMVRGRYKLSTNTQGVPLFGFAEGPNAKDMRGFSPIDYDRMIDWAFFFTMPGSDRNLVQSSRPIDTRLPTALFKLHEGGVVPPGDVVSLAARNLNRGRTYQLPSGQAVARAMGLPRSLILAPDRATVDNLGVRETPLWYYILQEAKQQGVRPLEAAKFSLANAGPLAESEQVYAQNVTTSAAQAQKVQQLTGSEGGDILGPVGGTIVGEVLLGLIDHYQTTTGHGLAFTSEIDGRMTTTPVPGIGNVYQVGNMIVDAGVGNPVR